MSYNTQSLALSQEILELIDNADEMTRSDLQGVVDALAMRLTNEHITKREIFERIRDIRENMQDPNHEQELNAYIDALLDLETAVLQDCRQ